MTRERRRDEGQWALGSREPLNDNERFKKEEDPLRVRERIERTYSREGFASIPPDDLRGRFRWWGLYTQRRPGIDGGRTATLAPEELDDEHFMLRVRVDGGELGVAQLREIAALSTEFARDTADITDRQNIQLHWIRVEDVPEIWRRLEAVGLSTTEACGDCPSSGWAVGWRPPPDSPNAPEPGCRLRRWPRSGRRWPDSSATTDTGGCATGPA